MMYLYIPMSTPSASFLCLLVVVFLTSGQVIINYLVDQAEKRATSSRKKADQVQHIVLRFLCRAFVFLFYIVEEDNGPVTDMLCCVSCVVFMYCSTREKWGSR